LVTYLQKGGVVLYFGENGINNFMSAIFGVAINSSGLANMGGTGQRDQLPVLNDDPILNGPFGNIGGQYWGEDAAGTTTSIPAASLANAPIVVYSTATNALYAGNITAFRHKSMNLLWVGDGGFNSSADTADLTICPLQVNSDNTPRTKTYGPAPYTGQVINSFFTANALAWALNQANSPNGINASKR
jgi:hypothetical protein